jgi:murein peptide amidase A
LSESFVLPALKPVLAFYLLFCLLGNTFAQRPQASSPSSPPSSPAAQNPSIAATPASGICPDYWRSLPNLKQSLCLAAGLQDSGARSVKDRPLLMRDVGTSFSKVRVLVIGGIHGDELSSSSVVFHWIAMAMNEPVSMPQSVQWRFIPALNPDGLVVRRRTNANGVDLNRNFPTPNWDKDASIYWEKRTQKDPRRWPGKSPLSEPESRFLHEQMASFKPHLIVSIHAPYGVLDFDGPAVPPSKLGRLYLDQVGIFPGSLGHFAGVHKGWPVVTIELPQSMKTPLDSETRQMWLDLLRWIGQHVGSKS